MRPVVFNLQATFLSLQVRTPGKISPKCKSHHIPTTLRQFLFGSLLCFLRIQTDAHTDLKAHVSMADYNQNTSSKAIDSSKISFHPRSPTAECEVTLLTVERFRIELNYTKSESASKRQQEVGLR